MLGWLGFSRLIWRLKLFDTACVCERSRYSGKGERQRRIYLSLEEESCGCVTVPIPVYRRHTWQGRNQLSSLRQRGNTRATQLAVH